MSADRRYPLANDLHGDPLDMPETAAAWRVRRSGTKKARPQIIFGTEGKQLEVPLGVTIDELRAFGCPPGRYRLEAVDGAGKSIPDLVAYTAIGGGEAGDEDGDDEESDRPRELPRNAGALSLVGDEPPLMRALLHIVDTNSRVMEALASAFGQVRPVQHEPMFVERPASAGPTERPDQVIQSVFGGLTSLKSLFDAWQTGTKAGGGGPSSGPTGSGVPS